MTEKCQRCGRYMNEDNERWVALDEKWGPRRQWHICDKCEAEATEWMLSFMVEFESQKAVDEFSEADELRAELTELWRDLESRQGYLKWWQKTCKMHREAGRKLRLELAAAQATKPSGEVHDLLVRLDELRAELVELGKELTAAQKRIAELEDAARKEPERNCETCEDESNAHPGLCAGLSTHMSKNCRASGFDHWKLKEPAQSCEMCGRESFEKPGHCGYLSWLRAKQCRDGDDSLWTPKP